ncbi:MAG: Gfo/Idh/MocA family oxidoreductase [Planctomycetaceae bacterium]
MENGITVALLTHGGGAHVAAYLAALRDSPDCQQVVLADPDGRWETEARRVLGRKLTRVSKDHGKLLSTTQPSLALVTMEARLAPAVIEIALDANCHIFAEKPACVRPDDFARLVAKADSKHRHLMLALANRTNPETIQARRIFRRGDIGRLFGIEMHIIADQTRLTRPAYHQQWFADKHRAGGGHLIWLGIHWLDLAMHITGTQVRQACGFTQNVGGQPINVEDSAVAALRFDNGALGTVTSGYYVDKGYHTHIKVWGSHGWLHLDSMHERPLQWSSSQGAHAGQLQEFKGSKEPRGYTPFVRAAIQACARGTDPPISNAESLRALQTVFAIYKSSDTGRVQIIAGAA